MQHRGKGCFFASALGAGNAPPATLNSASIPVRIILSLILTSAILIYPLVIASGLAQAADDFAEKYLAYIDYVQSGSASLQKKDYASAITNYSKAIEISPFEINNYYNRGIAFYRSGKDEEAEADFDKVIVMDPRMSSAYVYRGLCRERLGRCKEALNDYTRALELKPNDAAIHNNIAHLYVSAKDESFRDKSKALEHAKKAAELSREKNAEILDTLARAYFINGMVKKAVDSENKALKLEPYNDEFKEKLREYEKEVDSDIARKH